MLSSSPCLKSIITLLTLKCSHVIAESTPDKVSSRLEIHVSIWLFVYREYCKMALKSILPLASRGWRNLKATGSTRRGISKTRVPPTAASFILIRLALALSLCKFLAWKNKIKEALLKSSECRVELLFGAYKRIQTNDWSCENTFCTFYYWWRTSHWEYFQVYAIEPTKEKKMCL